MARCRPNVTSFTENSVLHHYMWEETTGGEEEEEAESEGVSSGGHFEHRRREGVVWRGALRGAAATGDLR